MRSFVFKISCLSCTYVYCLHLIFGISNVFLLCAALISPREITADLWWKFNEAPRKEAPQEGPPTEEAKEEGPKKLVIVSGEENETSQWNRPYAAKVTFQISFLFLL